MLCVRSAEGGGVPLSLSVLLSIKQGKQINKIYFIIYIVIIYF
jgi:hypothetical protein